MNLTNFLSRATELFGTKTTIDSIKAALDTEISGLKVSLADKDAKIVSLETAAANTGNAELVALKEEHAKLSGEAKATAEKLATATAELEAAKARLADPKSEAARQAQRIAASQGIPPVTGTPANGNGESNSNGSLLEQYAAITDTKLRAEFYAKHWKKIFSPA